jgi:biopolymer transport protein ExbB/TolQ
VAQGLLAGAVGLLAGAAALAAHRALMRTAHCHERRMKDFVQEFSAIVSRQIEPRT